MVPIALSRPDHQPAAEGPRSEGRQHERQGQKRADEDRRDRQGRAEALGFREAGGEEPEPEREPRIAQIRNPGQQRASAKRLHRDPQQRERDGDRTGKKHRPEDRGARGEMTARAPEGPRDQMRRRRGRVEKQRGDEEVTKEMRRDHRGKRVVDDRAPPARRMALGRLARKSSRHAAIRWNEARCSLRLAPSSLAVATRGAR